MSYFPPEFASELGLAVIIQPVQPLSSHSVMPGVVDVVSVIGPGGVDVVSVIGPGVVVGGSLVGMTVGSPEPQSHSNWTS